MKKVVDDLVNKEYTKVNDNQSKAEKYIKQLQIENSTFLPFEYHAAEDYGPFKISYLYYFFDYNDEMVPRFVEVWIINKRTGEHLFHYEKENLKMEKTNPTEFKGVLKYPGRNDSVMNPTLYLWR